MVQQKTYWHKLDNAAKVFPAVSKHMRSNVFRISFFLDEIIDPTILEDAVNLALKRFQTFAIELKKGLFWNYFAANKRRFKVALEPSVLCKYFKFSRNNGYLFKVYYLDHKVSLEMFHSLSDGTGGMHLMKQIVFNYYKLKGESLDSEGKLLGEKAFSNKENEDLFVKYYDKHNKAVLREEKAYHLDGERFKDYWNLLLKIQLESDAVRTLAKTKYGATVTQYLNAVLAHAIYEEGINAHGKKPIKVFIPVNLRAFFDHHVTMRNFSLFIKTTFSGQNRTWTFDEMIEETRNSFQDQLVKEKLVSRFSSNVSMEKNIFLRMTPLFIKNIAFKIGYRMLGSSIHTASFSNLGIIDLPSDLKKHVLDIDFITAGSSITASAITYQNHLNWDITSCFKDTTVLYAIVNRLVQDGLKVVIDTNYEEGYDEIL